MFNKKTTKFTQFEIKLQIYEAKQSFTEIVRG